MATRQRRQTYFSRLVMPAVTIGFLTYFAFHAFHGEYGMVAEAQLEREAQRLASELAELKGRRDLLERRVALLRPESLDPDLIDERARMSLNLAHPDEVVILRPR